MTPERRDVVIAGAGLVGLALAAALARHGLTVALLDRAPNASPAASDGWDVRVYAISPGSAAFLQRLGAWQALSCERIAAIESMHIVGDSGATLGFSAYELGERALAWIVEERALRGALLPAIHVPGIDFVAGASFASLAWSANEGMLKLDDGRVRSMTLDELDAAFQKDEIHERTMICRSGGSNRRRALPGRASRSACP